MSGAANKVFIGNLTENIRESDIREKFEKFGHILTISVKSPPRPPAFAFIVRSSRRKQSHVRIGMNHVGPVGI
jgi:RNA recognition motif-containing protein